MNSDTMYAGTIATLSAMAKKGYVYVTTDVDGKVTFASENSVRGFDSWEDVAAFASKED